MNRVLFCAAKSIIEPLGLLHLAGLARDLGWERQFELIEDHNFEPLFETIRDFKPKVIGFNIYTGNHLQVFDAINKIKKIDNSITTVVGGPHATYFPLDCAKIVDFVVMSEGFLSLKKILQYEVEPGILPMTSTMEFPQPDRRLLYSKYPEYAVSKIKSIISMTGCPYRCTYCYNSSSPSDIALTPELADRLAKSMGMGGRLFPFNVRTVDSVIKEAQEIVDNWKTDILYFQDDVHGFDTKSWMKDLAEVWMKKIGIPYHAQMRWEMTRGISGLQRLDLLKKAGCSGLTLAIESADPIIRDEVLDRKIEESIMFEGMKAVTDRGFKVRTEQISGLPYGATTKPTPMNLDADILLIKLALDLKEKSNGPSMSWVSTLAPYMGTKLGSYCVKYGHYSDTLNSDVPDTFFERSVLRFPKEWIGPDLEKRKEDPGVWLSETELEKYRNQNAAFRKYFHVFTMIPKGDVLAKSFLDNLDFTIPTLCKYISNHLGSIEGSSSSAIISNIQKLKLEKVRYPEYFGCIPFSNLAISRYERYIGSKEDSPSTLSTATRHHLYDELLYKV